MEISRFEMLKIVSGEQAVPDTAVEVKFSEELTAKVVALEPEEYMDGTMAVLVHMMYGDEYEEDKVSVNITYPNLSQEPASKELPEGMFHITSNEARLPIVKALLEAGWIQHATPKYRTSSGFYNLIEPGVLGSEAVMLGKE